MVAVAELPAATAAGDNAAAVREYPDDGGGTVIGVLLPPPPQAVSKSDKAKPESRIAKFTAFRFIGKSILNAAACRPLCVNTGSRTSTRRNGKYCGHVAYFQRLTDAAYF